MAEHTTLLAQFGAERRVIEASENLSPEEQDYRLLRELQEKGRFEDWLGERYAEMRSSVAQIYHFPEATPAVRRPYPLCHFFRPMAGRGWVGQARARFRVAIMGQFYRARPE